MKQRFRILLGVIVVLVAVPLLLTIIVPPVSLHAGNPTDLPIIIDTGTASPPATVTPSPSSCQRGQLLLDTDVVVTTDITDTGATAIILHANPPEFSLLNAEYDEINDVFVTGDTFITGTYPTDPQLQGMAITWFLAGRRHITVWVADCGEQYKWGILWPSVVTPNQ